MEKSIWFVGWKNEKGEYNEVKVCQSEIDAMPYEGVGKGDINPLPKCVINKYGQYAWDNMIYLQNIELVNEEKGYYKMHASDPNSVHPETKGRVLIVDENKKVIGEFSEVDIR